MKAVLKRQYDGREKAQAILMAVQPDNLKAPPGIKIVSLRSHGSLNITVDSTKGLGSLISTLDDLLSCISAAERTLENL